MTFSNMMRRSLLTAAVMATGSMLVPVIDGGAVHADTIQTQTSAPSRDRAFDSVAGEAATALATLRAYLDSGESSLGASYAEQRSSIATEIADRLMIEPIRMQVAWAAADTDHQMAIMAGLTQLGVPYRRNSSKENEGFDCSGFTTYAWGEAGYTLARQSGTQIRQGAARTAETAQAGDLVQYPGHVMMWLGVDKAIVHSPYTGRNVEVDYVTRKHSVRYADPTE